MLSERELYGLQLMCKRVYKFIEGLISPVTLFETKGIIVMTNTDVIRVLDKNTLECKDLKCHPNMIEEFFEGERKKYGSYRADYNIIQMNDMNTYLFSRNCRFPTLLATI